METNRRRKVGFKARINHIIRSNTELYNRNFMNWDDFTTYTEAVSWVRDTDTVLQILVGCMQRSDYSFELCTIANQEKRGFLKRFFFSYLKDDHPEGYLLAWDYSGVSDHIKEVEKQRWEATNPQPFAWQPPPPFHNIHVPYYREDRAWKGITWGGLKQLVCEHPDYQRHGRVGRISISACKAEHVQIGLRETMAPERFTGANSTDLFILGETPATAKAEGLLRTV